MIGLFARLLGRGDVVEAGIKGIDSVFYTDQEKAENKKEFLKLYEPFKVAQRYLALIFSIPYVMGWAATFVASFFSMNVDKQIELLTGDIGVIVGIIVGFYFLGGAGTGFKK